MTKPKILLMGVSGCGKSLIGARLAEVLQVPFHDADSFHSEANVHKMASGVPLTDDDRADWLATLANLIRSEPALVLGCSALKRRYRDLLRDGNPDLQFLYLHGDYDTILPRLERRQDHYFAGAAMLRNQFEQLEPPDNREACSIDIRLGPDEIVKACLDTLRR